MASDHHAPVSSLSPQVSATVPIRRFCTFRISDRHFGVDILQVKEINAESRFTPVHHAPPQVHGYVNIRGQIHLVLDPRPLLGLPLGRQTDGAMLLVFKDEVAHSAAMLVDSIGDIIEVPEDRIETDQDSDADALSRSVCKLEGELVVVLEPAAFLRPAQA